MHCNTTIVRLMSVWLQVGRGDSLDTLDKGVIHVPGGMEWDRMSFHCVTQNYAISDSKILCLLNFPFTISNCD